MPDVTITVGGREFQVACEEGEEGDLRAAARMLDAEASGMGAEGARLPTARMLLMSGLLIADKATTREGRALTAENRIRELEAELAALRSERAGHAGKAAKPKKAAKAEQAPAPAEPVPVSVVKGLARAAARAEELATAVEAAAGAGGARKGNGAG